jgi:glutamine cyclotransferase
MRILPSKYLTVPDFFFFLALFFSLGIFAACNGTDRSSENAGDNSPAIINYTVVRQLPHDTSAFTEGLLFHEGQLYESTGTDSLMPEDRRSLFGVVDTLTGKISPKAELDRKKFFGEGICFLGDKVYQLTWKTKLGFIYDARSFKKLGEFTIPVNEGWGMTTDGTHLMMSDGSSNVSYVDPQTFHVVRVLTVSDNNGPVGNVNELELIHGFLYANEWQTDYILKIDTATGKVLGKLDLSSLSTEARAKYGQSAELNGIAYDSATGKVYVTGKLWPTIYEIKFPL